MQMMMKMGMTSGKDAEVVEFDLKLIKRRLTVQEDETERVGDGGDGGECARARACVYGGCSDVTARRAADCWRRKPRQRRRDATKALITADTAFTRSLPIKWIYSTPVWGNSEGFITFFLCVACLCWELTGE